MAKDHFFEHSNFKNYIMNLSSTFVVWKCLGLALQIKKLKIIFFPPGLSLNKEEICIESVYGGGFSEQTSLNFTSNYLCAILKKIRRIWIKYSDWNNHLAVAKEWL